MRKMGGLNLAYKLFTDPFFIVLSRHLVLTLNYFSVNHFQKKPTLQSQQANFCTEQKIQKV